MKNNKARIKPIIAVLCDEIRLEANNKPFIIGIYTGVLSVDLPPEAKPGLNKVSSKKVDLNTPVGIPKRLYLAMWVPFEVLDPEATINIDVEFQITGPDPDSKLNIKANLEDTGAAHDPYEMQAFSFSGLPMKMTQSGELNIFFRHTGDEHWEKLRTMKVEVNPYVHTD